MWFFKKIPSLLAALPSGLTMYTVCVVLGASLGGYSVHKLHDLAELETLKEQTARLEQDRATRITMAQHAAEMEMQSLQKLDETKRKVAAHVPRTPACNLNSDAIRLLNELRGEM